MATVAVISRRRGTIAALIGSGFECYKLWINDSYFFAEDHARRILPLVLLQYRPIVFGVGKYALEFLNCQPALELCVTLLLLYPILLLFLISLFAPAFVLNLLDLLALGLCLLGKLFVIVLDPDDALVTFRV